VGGTGKGAGTGVQACMCALMCDTRARRTGVCVGQRKCAYLSVRACVRARVGRCRLSLLIHLSARIFTLLAYLLARLAHDDRCRSPCSLASPPASSPLPPPSSPTTSLPTHLLARLYAHLDSHRGPTSPDRLPSPPPRPLPHPPDTHLYCVLPAMGWGGQGVREGVQTRGGACVRSYGRSVHAFVEPFV